MAQFWYWSRQQAQAFLRGVGTVFSLFPTAERAHETLPSEAQSIADDFCAVGMDIHRAMIATAEKHGIEIQETPRAAEQSLPGF